MSVLKFATDSTPSVTHPPLKASDGSEAFAASPVHALQAQLAAHMVPDLDREERYHPAIRLLLPIGTSLAFWICLSYTLLA